MALADKYQSIVDLANQNGVSDLVVQEQDGVLHICGLAPSDEVKQKLWDEYNRLDPDMRAGDLVMAIEVSGGAETYYTVKAGDNLSRIASHYEGVTWQEIFEANSAGIKNPDRIFPGQKLLIPQK